MGELGGGCSSPTWAALAGDVYPEAVSALSITSALQWGTVGCPGLQVSWAEVMWCQLC